MRDSTGGINMQREKVMPFEKGSQIWGFRTAHKR